MTAEKVWLKSYPEGIPATIDPELYASLPHLLEESFSRFAERKAYACMGSTMYGIHRYMNTTTMPM